MEDSIHKGICWEVNSDNFLVNSFAEKELDGTAKKLSKIFLDEIFSFTPLFHSAYIGGSYLTKTETEKSDIDFLVLVHDEDDEEEMEEILERFNPHLKKKIKEKYDLDIEVDTSVHTKDFFSFDLLNNFIQKCIWGQNISISRLNFDLITNKVLDGMELDDIEYLRRSFFKVSSFFTISDKLDEHQIKLVQSYIKLLLRCCFNSVCKKYNVWTKDLYYCRYYFCKEYPEFEKITSDLILLYLMEIQEIDEMKRIIKDSFHLIDRLKKTVNESTWDKLKKHRKTV